jgi:hypothetical protein
MIINVIILIYAFTVFKVTATIRNDAAVHPRSLLLLHDSLLTRLYGVARFAPANKFSSLVHVVYKYGTLRESKLCRRRLKSEVCKPLPRAVYDPVIQGS